MAVETGLIAEIKRQIDGMPENDTERLTLILLTSIYEEVTEIKENPAVKMGEFISNYTAVSVSIFAVFLLLLVLLPDVLLKIFGVTLPVFAP